MTPLIVCSNAEEVFSIGRNTAVPEPSSAVVPLYVNGKKFNKDPMLKIPTENKVEPVYISGVFIVFGTCRATHAIANRDGFSFLWNDSILGYLFSYTSNCQFQSNIAVNVDLSVALFPVPLQVDLGSISDVFRNSKRVIQRSEPTSGSVKLSFAAQWTSDIPTSTFSLDASAKAMEKTWSVNLLSYKVNAQDLRDLDAIARLAMTQIQIRVAPVLKDTLRGTGLDEAITFIETYFGNLDKATTIRGLSEVCSAPPVQVLTEFVKLHQLKQAQVKELMRVMNFGPDEIASAMEQMIDSKIVEVNRKIQKAADDFEKGLRNLADQIP